MPPSSRASAIPAMSASELAGNALTPASRCATTDPVLRFELAPELYRQQVENAVSTMRAWAAEASQPRK